MGLFHQQFNDGNASVQHDGTGSRPHPHSISPGEHLETLIKKWNLWIEYYWNVPDARDIVPVRMRKTNSLGQPIRLQLQNYSKQRGDILRSLYQLARITQGRKDSAWAEIEKSFESRSGDNGKGTVIGNRDVRAALDHFRLLREDEEDPFTDTSGRLPFSASNFDEVGGEEDEHSTTAAPQQMWPPGRADREEEYDQLAPWGLRPLPDNWAGLFAMQDAPQDDETESQA